MTMPPRKVLVIGGAAVVAAIAVLVIVMRRRAAELEQAEGSAAGMLPASLTSTEGQRDDPASLGLVLPGSNAAAIGGGGGDAAAPPPESGSAPAEQAAAFEPAGDPVVDALIAQGVTIAPEGTTVDFQGTTYDVSGTPEFSAGNFNPNSPAGVLAMNQALGLTSAPVTIPGTVIGSPSSVPNFYESDNEQVLTANVIQGGKYVAV